MISTLSTKFTSSKMETADYGMAPRLCSGLRFLMPALGEDKGGRIFACDTPEDLAKLKKFYDDLGKTSAAFFSWTIVQDNVLVQLNGEVASKDVESFKTVLSWIAQPDELKAKIKALNPPKSPGQ